MSEEISKVEPVHPKFANFAEEAAYLEVQLKKAQLEDMDLQKKERQMNMLDVRARINDRELKDLQRKNDRESQGLTFAQQSRTDSARQAACTHKKGGVVTPRDMRVLSTGGNGQQYAIIKHQMINGDMWVRCLRCGKTWCPPVKENFYFNKRGKVVAPKDGEFDQVKFNESKNEYQRAVNFETNNSPSGSVQCRFSKYNEATGDWVDAAQEYRESIASTNLR
jgi:hypothetical protein